MKKNSLFTDEELEAMRLADEEIEESFAMSPEDWKRSKAIDKQARLDHLDNKGQAHRVRVRRQDRGYHPAENAIKKPLSGVAVRKSGKGINPLLF